MGAAQKLKKVQLIHRQMSTAYVTGLKGPPSWFYLKEALKGHFLLKMSYTTVDKALADDDNCTDWHMFVQTGHELSHDTFSSLLKKLPQLADCKMCSCKFPFENTTMYHYYEPHWVDMTGSTFLEVNRRIDMGTQSVAMI